MALSIDTVKCDRCGTCISVCPSNALCLTVDLEVNTDVCIQCGVCVKICPFNALKIETKV